MASRIKQGLGNRDAVEDQGKVNKKGEKDRQRIERKERQRELTDNIALSYQTIRPTIIQAQRVLKILDTLKTKFAVTKYLNFEFVRHFEDATTLEGSNLDKSKIAMLSRPTLEGLAKIAAIQRKMLELLEQETVQESQAGEEEQDESRRDEDLEDEDNQEARERRAREEAERERIRQEREDQVMTFKHKMEGDFNNLVRFLERDHQEFALVKVNLKSARA